MKPSDFICYLPKWQFFYGPTGQRWALGSVKSVLGVDTKGLQELVRSGEILPAPIEDSLEAHKRNWQRHLAAKAEREKETS